jgi:hypothetical protein
MKHRLIVALVALIVATNLCAQTDRNVVYRCVRGNLTYTQPVAQKESVGKTVGKVFGSVLQAAAGSASSKTNHPEYEEAVKDAILGGIGSARRIRMVDMLSVDDLAEDEDAMYCDASISSITSTTRIRTWTDKDKKKHEVTEYSGCIVGTVNLKSVRTGSIVISKTLNSSSVSSGWCASEDEALGFAISSLKSYLRSSVNDAFPLYASIVEGKRATDKKAKEVYIDLGENWGCYKGQHFDVYTVKTVAGKEAKKRIGQLKISETMGDDISACKVQSGGADIKLAIEAGETLLITSKD